MSDRPQQLAHLDFLGDATKFSGQIHALIPKCVLLENFSHAEVRLLSHFMDVYMCGQGAEIIREGEGGDFMLMIIEGRVEVMKRDRWNTQQVIAVVDAGQTLGEKYRNDGPPPVATRLADSPYEIWKDILETNSANIGAALDAYIAKLTALRKQLPAVDAEFAAGADFRRKLKAAVKAAR